MKRVGNLYPQVTSFANLYEAFRRAWRGSNRTAEAMAFAFNLEHELFRLHDELRSKTYRPGPYRYFTIIDPKVREIAAAPFRDRVVHHALVAVLEPIYERRFIVDSYATRKGKGAHKAVIRAQEFVRTSRWYLQMDISKYFPSVDHGVLMQTLRRKLKDREVLWLLETILSSHNAAGVGIPIGNLTSQFLANVYLDPFDHWVKDELGVRKYLRYMDDFVLFDTEKERLVELAETIPSHLEECFRMRLKVMPPMVQPVKGGLSFLGMRVYGGCLRFRSENRRRSFRRLKQRTEQYQRGSIDEETYRQSLESVVGHLRYFNPHFPVNLADGDEWWIG